jgi:hypothetical protein
MIQRKQTVFLILAFVLTVVCMIVSSSASLWHLVCLLLSAVLSIVSVFLYKKRILQANLCLLNIVALLAWYILVAVLPQYDLLSQWTSSLPAVSIILVFMARQGILADEKLVRSLDRIR